MTWNPSALDRFAGKAVVVTGANSGIGLHTAAALAAHGARVTMACRNVDKAKAAADQIRSQHGNADLEIRQLDLSSLASVRAFAEGWTEPLDLLINNAGVLWPPKWEATEDGFELQFGTNYLGHFALTGRLLPRLLEAREPRVVSVSSVGHNTATRDVVKGNPKDAIYIRQLAYGNSKLANLMFAIELQRRSVAHGSSLVSVAAHPGYSATGLYNGSDGMGRSILGKIMPLVNKVIAQSSEAGAQPTLYAAAVGDPGGYYGPSGPLEFVGQPSRARIRKLALDEALGKQLWDNSVRWTSVDFSW